MTRLRKIGNRHGRPPRGSITGNLGTKPPMRFFETVVSQAVDFLKAAWPEELAQLQWKVLDAPLNIGAKGEVDRYRINRNAMQITLYRLPIERLTHHRRTDRLDERFHIEQYVFIAAAELIGKDPNDLLPDNFDG